VLHEDLLALAVFALDAAAAVVARSIGREEVAAPQVSGGAR